MSQGLVPTFSCPERARRAKPPRPCLHQETQRSANGQAVRLADLPGRSLNDHDDRSTDARRTLCPLFVARRARWEGARGATRTSGSPWRDQPTSVGVGLRHRRVTVPRPPCWRAYLRPTRSTLGGRATSQIRILPRRRSAARISIPGQELAWLEGSRALPSPKPGGEVSTFWSRGFPSTIRSGLAAPMAVDRAWSHRSPSLRSLRSANGMGRTIGMPAAASRAAATTHGWSAWRRIV